MLHLEQVMIQSLLKNGCRISKSPYEVFYQDKKYWVKSGEKDKEVSQEKAVERVYNMMRLKSK